MSRWLMLLPAAMLSMASCDGTMPTSYDTSSTDVFHMAGSVQPPANGGQRKEGAVFASDLPFPQAVHDYVATRRPPVSLERRATIGPHFTTEWGENTLPDAQRIRAIQQTYGTVDAQKLTISRNASAGARGPSSVASNSAMTSGDTLFVYLSSWIDPDASGWIYFGSYTHTSEPVTYTNVTGYTFVDQQAWISLFDETYYGWGSSVGVAYPYVWYGGGMFEQVGHHYMAHSIWEATGETYVWWFNL